MPDIAGHIDAMQHQVGHGQHVGQRFFLNAVDAVLQRDAVCGCSDLCFQVLNGAGQEAARATGRVQHALAQLRVENVHHELGDRAGRVVLASIARRLQIGQDFS